MWLAGVWAAMRLRVIGTPWRRKSKRDRPQPIPYKVVIKMSYDF